MNILVNQESFIIVDKPYDISSHHTPGDSAPDLVSIISTELGRKLAPITRLDKQAKGLVLMSDDSQFTRKHKILKKTYRAIVFGHIPTQVEIDKDIYTKSIARRKLVSKSASSKVTPIRTLNLTGREFTEVEVEIATGRNHQIRKHLASIGHHILGDFRHGLRYENVKIEAVLGKKIELQLICNFMQIEYLGKEWSAKSNYKNLST